MARLTQRPVTTPGRNASHPDSLTDLTRLLDRLQQNLLHADAEREHRLRTNEYERRKSRINIQYARTLLTKLEQDAAAIKVHSQRQAAQTDLNLKREIYEQLEERLRELEDLSIDSDEEDDDDSGEEDLLGDIIETPSRSSESRAGEHEQGGGEGEEDEWGGEEGGGGGESTVLPEHEQPTLSTTTESWSQPQSQLPRPKEESTTISPTLRARGTALEKQQREQPTDTASTTSALRSQLFTQQPSTTSATTSATAEAILDHHRAEQDKLTESMVSMAQALKKSTHAFSSALQEDKDVLEGAGKGLDKNERGLETISGRMGTLRRLTEGEGWWGRMMLYAWIAGLAVFAVLLVFVFPKLRF
ncbi:hypothetical protein GGS20DRAFT_594014 [Poronia punctata]|nr:hypothetical protein GGS20DRAFT_594014 [Poronia punctata]